MTETGLEFLLFVGFIMLMVLFTYGVVALVHRVTYRDVGADRRDVGSQKRRREDDDDQRPPWGKAF